MVYVLTIREEDQKEEIQLPQSWNDLDPKQQQVAYKILMSDKPGILSAQEVIPHLRLSLFLLLSGKDEAFLAKWQADCRAAADEIEEGDHIFLAELDECLSTTNLFFKQGEKEHVFELNFGLTKCPLPKIEGIPSAFKSIKRKKSWYAPVFDEESGDGLSNINLYELANTFTLFERMIVEQHPVKKEALITRLLATIYRPGKSATKENVQSGYGGDRRLPLQGHEATISERQHQWKMIPKEMKQLLVFWFASCRRYIIEQYPVVFKMPTDQQGEKAVDYGWGGVLLELAGGLQHLNEIYAQPYQNGLIYLSRLEQEAERREMEAKKRGLQKIR